MKKSSESHNQGNQGSDNGWKQDEDGIYVVECPALPGCISDGRTREEAIENIKDAIEGYLESLRKHNEPIPPPISEEIEIDEFVDIMK